MTESRDLSSVCYDGHVIITRWPGGRWAPYSQQAQADEHRNRVRQYLHGKGLCRDDLLLGARIDAERLRRMAA